MSHPEVYLILGARGSGRCEIIRDLIEATPDELNTSAYLHEEEIGSAVLDDLNVHKASWASLDAILNCSFDQSAERIFFVSSGILNPVDQIEAFHTCLKRNDVSLTRIIAVVHGSLAKKHAELETW